MTETQMSTYWEYLKSWTEDLRVLIQKATIESMGIWCFIYMTFYAYLDLFILGGVSHLNAQEHAFSKLTCGAIKTAELAGAIFNHKNDKIGHYDIFCFWWWQHVGVPFTIPDVSNNQFQSFCDAAAALILYLDDFLAILESLHANKHNSTLNHMETNLKNALECSKTRSKLAVLAITTEAISYPYMKAICTSSDKNQNMLDLGPLHSKVYDHIQKIIADPNILIDADADYRTATLNGEEWENSAVVAKILELAPELPYFHELLVAFLSGALETWE
ncbi:hypothetical protein CPB84DRAFT_1851559 [Gymnopilus junonius]|uniref:Uncharacterized protein n=1 Tax=Gymnopilus junonius TaxID=109634 RepID=A0A9P5NDN7_GYMJU|nr:hypothetical protein CPB84DRAFT_1851559 [Gymnopilus junonius]